jgi:hypothetical protein
MDKSLESLAMLAKIIEQMSIVAEVRLSENREHKLELVEELLKLEEKNARLWI